MWDLSSLTRVRTRTPCIGRRSLNHWTTREVPIDGIICSLFLPPHPAMASLKIEYTSSPTVFDLGRVTCFCQWNVSGQNTGHVLLEALNVLVGCLPPCKLVLHHDRSMSQARHVEQT